MKTMRVYRLTNLSPTCFLRLKEAQQEAARVWNCCMELHKQARTGHTKWPGQRELEQATKGRFALNAQVVQQIVHAFLTNIKTTRTLRREHPEMRMKYPWRTKHFYPVKWPTQAATARRSASFCRWAKATRLSFCPSRLLKTLEPARSSGTGASSCTSA